MKDKNTYTHSKKYSLHSHAYSECLVASDLYETKTMQNKYNIAKKIGN